MLTKLIIRNFKLFEEIEIELGNRVLFIGPNNSGKTSALQALAVWKIGLDKWLEKRGAGPVPAKRPGVTINRRDFISVPVPAANLLWRNLKVRQGVKKEGKNSTQNILIDIIVEGISNGKEWRCGFEFDYANEESLYCRSLRTNDGNRMGVPEEVRGLSVAFLPPMSGLAANETRIDTGAINVRIGEGRTAEVLRNLCYDIHSASDKRENWGQINEHMQSLFGVSINDPVYIQERGEIRLDYTDRQGNRLDISASGRGQQQTLLLLAYMFTHPHSILLLDEPDAHLEILRQGQIYDLLGDIAEQQQLQIIAASHSEMLLNRARDKDIVVAFVGKPHRIDDRGSQVMKALKDIGFEHYAQAEERGWVLYLEGSTDQAILKRFAHILKHEAEQFLNNAYVHYVGNQPKKAEKHFFGLREAKSDLVGIGIYDRLERELPENSFLKHIMWNKKEIENYLCTEDVLLAYAEAKGREMGGELFAQSWRQSMEESIGEIENALQTLNKSPWGDDIKASDEFLDPLFEKFYEKLGLDNLMRKTNYHELASFIRPEDIHDDVKNVLDNIVEVAKKAGTNILM